MQLIHRIRSIKSWWFTWGCLPVFDWIKASDLYRAGRYQQAANLYRAGLEKHPQHHASTCARIDLAYCLFKICDFRGAERILKDVIAFDASYKDAYVRLAQLHLWLGFGLEAAWAARRGLKQMPHDSELVGLFIRAVLDNGGPSYLLSEALRELKSLKGQSQSLKIQVSRARALIMQGYPEEGREMLKDLANLPTTSLEAVLYFGEQLLRENKIAEAREYLQRALAASPEHPRVLSLLAETYLIGDTAEPEFAAKLATQACQATRWSSPRDMHVLADAHLHNGDKMSALLVASRARDMGSRLMGSYSAVKSLDELIENLSSGTIG